MMLNSLVGLVASIFFLDVIQGVGVLVVVFVVLSALFVSFIKVCEKIFKEEDVL